MFTKFGESIEISRIEDVNTCVAAVDNDILEQFKKTAASLKKIAPKAEDFLYFSAVIMHSAEAAAINDDGSPKLMKNGEPVKVGWDTSNGTWKWITNDASIKCTKNSNGDIFPASELIKAHKKWIHKPLCIDHKSSSVDHVRGFIVDTYYDLPRHRVIALCALDKVNYPDLARKVTTGYSNNVSMGVGVGRAICTDCGKVARVEADFCTHMKNKNGYGEINVDLNPIELSIVVNGADPKAQIKHIIASANALNSYVDLKQEQLKKIAETTYTANISVNQNNGDATSKENKNANFAISTSDLESFKEEIQESFKKLEDLNNSLENSTNESVSDQLAESKDKQNADSEDNLSLAPPASRFASNIQTDSFSELRVIASVIETKLSQMKQSLDKLASINNKEEHMELGKKAYFQGTEEPKSGQTQYSIDPLNIKDRNSEDKQMVGVVNTGSEGMYPGDKETKEKLLRAETEARTMRRNAIVNLAKQALESKAYYQSGNKENDLTPGKPKYPVDKLNEEDRNKNDKQMVGKKPFPGVGPVDGLYPEDLKTKEMLSRANVLSAKFKKASNEDGSQNINKSAWNVFLGDKLLLSASVDELSGNKAEMFYDSIATKEFGTKLINNIKAEGAEKVRNMIKSAQTPTPMPAPAPAPEAPTPEAPAAPMEDLDAPVDSGKNGDPKENIPELAEKINTLSSDLVEAARALNGEQVEMGKEPMAQEPVPEMGATASFSTATLNSLRKELNSSLIQAMKESIANLNDHGSELKQILAMDSNALKTDMAKAIVADSVTEAKSAIADGFKLMTAFVKYARGTQALVKRAEIDAQLKSLTKKGEINSLIDSNNAELSDVEDLINEDEDEDDEEVDFGDKEEVDLGGDGKPFYADEEDKDPNPDAEFIDSEIDPDVINLRDGTSFKGLTGHNTFDDEFDPDAILGDGFEDEEELDFNSADAPTLPKQEALKMVNETQSGQIVPAAKLATKAGRSELRAKLAAETLKYSPMIGEAHPKGGTTTKLDVKPTGDLAKVEDIEEAQKAMLDIAKAGPKVKKQAADIHTLVSQGKLNPADFDALIAEGLDKDAVAYYKKYYGQVDGGSEFASELIKEHVKAEMKAENELYRIKLARSYELAYDMRDRGLCHDDRASISAQVDEIMKFNDEGFDSLKRVVAKNELQRKVAMPVVGTVDSFQNNVSQEGNLYDQLSEAFSNTKKRNF